jgi:hypothetical protein
MPSTNEIRNTLTDPKPLYFAAGVIDKIREEAPERIAAVRATDPKEVQARFTKQAKETQAKVSETLGSIDTDIKKMREQAQHFALQSLGIAAEYAVKAREAYDELADRGRGAVKTWRGEDAGATEVTVEREPVKVAEPPAEPRGGAKPGTTGATSTTSTTSTTGTSGTSGTSGTAKNGQGSAGAASAAKKSGSAARKTTTARTTTAKTGPAKANGSKKTPPKSGS